MKSQPQLYSFNINVFCSPRTVSTPYISDQIKVPVLRLMVVLGTWSRPLSHHFLIENLCSLIFPFSPNLCWPQLPYCTYFYLTYDLTLFLLLHCISEPMLFGCPMLWPQFTVILDFHLHVTVLYCQNLELALKRDWGLLLLTKKE